jgi:aminopeptidase N
VDWWWNYRIWRFLPSGKVDSTIYSEQEFRPYVDAVYLQGVKFLDAARHMMGDEQFLAFFQDYAQRYAGRLADTRGALELLQAHSEKDLAPIIAEYFENAGQH